MLTFQWRSLRVVFVASVMDEEKVERESDVSSNSDEEPPPEVTPLAEDVLDAKALCWLFNHSSDQSVVSAALQAMGGLRRDFTATSVLLEAGALAKVEEAFQGCFQKDTAVDLQWHLNDPDGAELYCRAWLRLTWGQGKRWPFDLTEPLWILQDSPAHPNASVVASCAIAISSYNSTHSIFDLLAHLADSTSGVIQISQTTQCLLLDIICQCVSRWEVPNAVVEDTTVKAIPILIYLLERTSNSPCSVVRSAAAVALYSFVCGSIDLRLYDDEDLRQAHHCELMVPALSIIVEDRDKWALLDADVWNLIVKQLFCLASPVVAQQARFPRPLKEAARVGMTKVLARGELSSEMVSDKIFSDVLQVIYPLPDIPVEERTAITRFLVEQLTEFSHFDLALWSVFILERALTSCEMPVCTAFAKADGVEIILRVSRTAVMSSRRLAVDGIRVLFAYTNSLIQLIAEADLDAEERACLTSEVDDIFESDFFDTLCTVVSLRRWWLFEVSAHWMPCLQRLCTSRPRERIWPNVLKTFQQFADKNVNEEGYQDTINSLESMRQVSLFLMRAYLHGSYFTYRLFGSMTLITWPSRRSQIDIVLDHWIFFFAFKTDASRVLFKLDFVYSFTMLLYFCIWLVRFACTCSHLQRNL
jgi:hypothetical protein